LFNFNYYWRLFITPIAFFIFGFGGFILSLTIFPILYILPINEPLKIKISRYIVKNTFRLFILIIKNIGYLTYEIHGIEKLSKRDGLLIFSNHPTLLDVVFLLSIAKLPNCVVKQSVFNNPCTFFVVRTLGFIKNKGNAENVLSESVKILKQGDGLILFPEGTRTQPNGKITLKRGIAHIALKAKKNLTPVSIHCNPITLSKRHRWYNIPIKKTPHFYIKIHDDIQIKQFVSLNKEKPIIVRILTKHLEEILLRNE